MCTPLQQPNLLGVRACDVVASLPSVTLTGVESGQHVQDAQDHLVVKGDRLWLCGTVEGLLAAQGLPHVSIVDVRSVGKASVEQHLVQVVLAAKGGLLGRRLLCACGWIGCMHSQSDAQLGAQYPPRRCIHVGHHQHHVHELSSTFCVYVCVCVDDVPRPTGRTVRDVRFRTEFHAAIIAVYRGGRPLQGKLGDVVLAAGDALLLDSTPAFVQRARGDPRFALVTRVADTEADEQSSWYVW